MALFKVTWLTVMMNVACLFALMAEGKRSEDSGNNVGLLPRPTRNKGAGNGTKWIYVKNQRYEVLTPEFQEPNRKQELFAGLDDPESSAQSVSPAISAYGGNQGLLGNQGLGNQGLYSGLGGGIGNQGLYSGLSGGIGNQGLYSGLGGIGNQGLGLGGIGNQGLGLGGIGNQGLGLGGGIQNPYLNAGGLGYSGLGGLQGGIGGYSGLGGLQGGLGGYSGLGGLQNPYNVYGGQQDLYSQQGLYNNQLLGGGGGALGNPYLGGGALGNPYLSQSSVTNPYLLSRGGGGYLGGNPYLAQGLLNPYNSYAGINPYGSFPLSSRFGVGLGRGSSRNGVGGTSSSQSSNSDE